MLTCDGYSIVHYVQQNRIIIDLPQTIGTLKNTIEPVADRRAELSTDEMASLLMIVKKLFTKQETENADSD